MPRLGQGAASEFPTLPRMGAGAVARMGALLALMCLPGCSVFFDNALELDGVCDGGCELGQACIDGACVGDADGTDGGVDADGGGGLDADAAADAEDSGDADDAGDAGDGGGPDAPDVPVSEPNACGGTATLSGEPGSACGTCGRGFLVCEGPNDVVCIGDIVNELNGCDDIPFALGSSCNACGAVWRAETRPGRDGTYYCSGPQANACGGCGDLGDDAPGQPCTTSNGLAGILSCTDGDTLSCLTPDLNPCGGLEPLEPAGALPGDPCGECSLGIWTCNGTDEMLCDGPQPGVGNDGETEGLNDCDGCGVLPGRPGDPCDEGLARDRGIDRVACGGQWVCVEYRLECRNSPVPSNACGGCTVLSGAPGDACPGGLLGCAGPDALACFPDPDLETNLCGGVATLTGRPGQPCGACGGGRWACATPEEVVCVGGIPTNACGSCGGSYLAPDSECARPGFSWQCTGEGAGRFADGYSCEPSNDVNACGGVVELLPPPFETCGVCSTGIVACDGEDDTQCIDAPDAELRTWFRDNDEDTFGDADDSRVSCEAPVGFVLNDDDCDDTKGDVNPDATEIVGDEADSDCNDRELCWVDADGDGYLPDSPSSSPSLNLSCSDLREAPESAPRGDCDPIDPLLAPGFAHPCMDCDLVTDLFGTACDDWDQVVINEVLPYLGGVRIEVRNLGESGVALTGWFLKLNGDSALPIGTTNVPAGARVVIDLNTLTGATPPYDASVSATLRLRSPADVQQDEVVYGPVAALGTGESWCRIPDGTGPFVRCSATPSLPND